MKKLIRWICLAMTFTFVLFASTCFAALAPQPMPVGSSDGDWIYLGRFLSERDYPSLLEWETRMRPYTSNAEANGLYDVYYHHEHEGKGEGQGCYSYMMKGMSRPNKTEFSCILKMIPLDKKGVRINKSGNKFGTRLISIYGAPKGIFVTRILRVRTFDAVTHQMIENTTNYSLLNGNFDDSASSVYTLRMNCPFTKAMNMSTCPVRPYDMRYG